MKIFKRFIPLIFILTYIIPSFLFPVGAVGQGYVNTFEKVQSLLGIKCDVGEIFYNDGSLVFSADVTYPPLPEAILPYGTEAEEYMYICDFVLNYSYSDGCMFGLVFGKTEDGEYALTVRKNGVLEFSYVTDEGRGWQVLCSSKLSIAPEKSDSGLKHQVLYSLGAVIKNSYAFIYFDGAIVAEVHLPYSAKGDFGFCGRGVETGVDKVEVTYELPIIKSVSQSYDSEIYEHETNLISSPFTVYDDSMSADVNSSSQVVMFDVKAMDGVLYTECSDQTVLLSQRVELYRGKAILAFYIRDGEAGELLKQYLDSEAIYDAYIFSASATVLSDTLHSDGYRRGVLDLSASSSVNPSTVSAAIYSIGQRCVVISEKAADFETVYALRSRFITVFVKADGDDASVFNALSSGCDGIISSSGSACSQIIGAFPSASFCKSPVIIQEVSEISAYEKVLDGCGVIYLKCYTKDGELLSDGVSVSKIYSKAKADGRALLCRLEDKESADKLADICKKYSAQGDIFALCDLELAKYVNTRNNVLYAHVADGDEIHLSAKTSAAIYELESQLREINSVFFTSSQHSDELLRQLSYRGLGVYRLSSGDHGDCGFITSSAQEYAKRVMYLSAEEKESGTLITTHLFDGELCDVTAHTNIIPFGDGDKYSFASYQANDEYRIISSTVKKRELTADTEEETEKIGAKDKTFDFLSENISSVVVFVSAVLVFGGIGVYIFLASRTKKNREKDE